MHVAILLYLPRNEIPHRQKCQVIQQTLLKRRGETAKKGAPKQEGKLLLDGDGLKFGITRVNLSSIRAVGQDNNACQILVSARDLRQPVLLVLGCIAAPLDGATSTRSTVGGLGTSTGIVRLHVQ